MHSSTQIRTQPNALAPAALASPLVAPLVANPYAYAALAASPPVAALPMYPPAALFPGAPGLVPGGHMYLPGPPADALPPPPPVVGETPPIAPIPAHAAPLAGAPLAGAPAGGGPDPTGHHYTNSRNGLPPSTDDGYAGPASNNEALWPAPTSAPLPDAAPSAGAVNQSEPSTVANANPSVPEGLAGSEASQYGLPSGLAAPPTSDSQQAYGYTGYPDASAPHTSANDSSAPATGQSTSSLPLPPPPPPLEVPGTAAATDHAYNTAPGSELLGTGGAPENGNEVQGGSAEGGKRKAEETGEDEAAAAADKKQRWA
eukprot:TRINITY_DN4629_c0_g1_i1.p1 TRINITY_DN4629_c0_g1~~TRINITY_DN4629_c0_g1_i1.p1  ORF type:complete len:315 (+),score=74.18 TRINITY_DN4629_c0_g1_i1:536-1480(+)